MIEILILTTAIALVLVLVIIALVLLSEFRKQKRPSRFRFQRKAQSQLTPEQEQAIRPLAYLGGSIGVLASALARSAGLSMGEFFLWTVALALFVGLLTWLVLRNSSTQPSASVSAQPQHPSRPTELQRQLIRMCGGDRELAQRLVDHERWKEGQPEAWYWQAAIDTLIRDRR